MSFINFSGKQLPAWADFFHQEEYNEFIEHISDYFQRRPASYSFEDGAVRSADASEFGSEKMGLLNLAQFCRLRPRDEWKSMVGNHFDGLKRAAGFERDFSAKAHDFECVKDMIGVRVYPEEYVSAIKDGLVIGRRLADSIYAMLVFDFPDSIVNVRPEQTLQWPLSNEELFDLGIANIRKKYPVKIAEQRVDGVAIHLVVENHFYAPNILLDLNNEQAWYGERGLLVGVPNRHAVIMHRIGDCQTVQAIHRMIPAIYGMNKEGPGSISEKLYWMRKGVFTTLPYSIDSQNIRFDPPEEFVNLLRESDELSG